MISTAHLIVSWKESDFFFGGVVDAVERISLEREGGNKQDAGASKLRQQRIRSAWTKIFLSFKMKQKKQKREGGKLQGD